MGPVNWLAVILAAAMAIVIGLVWHGPLFPTERVQLLPLTPKRRRHIGLAIAMFLLSSAMLGHSLARIGPATLAVKPWLYWMQSGGLAIAFVIPAVLLTHARNETEGRRRASDCGFWLIAYLAMGTVFWALG